MRRKHVPHLRYEEVSTLPTNILLCTIRNVRHELNLETIERLFLHYGIVKCLILKQQGEPNTFLAQLPDALSCVKAKQEYSGRNLYPNCNLLTIEFSAAQDIKLQPGDIGVDFTQSKASPPGDYYTLPHGVQPIAQQYHNAPHSNFYETVPMPPSNFVAPPHPQLPAGKRKQNGEEFPNYFQEQTHACVRIQGLNNVSVEQIQNLVGLYGDVLRIQMFADGKSATVQFAKVQEAERVAQNLDNIPMNGEHWVITRLQIPFIVPGKRVYDFFDSPKHRWRCNSRGSLIHFTKPNTNIFISSINHHTTREDLKRCFQEHGPIVRVVTFSTGKGYQRKMMAVIQMERLEDAIKAVSMLEFAEVGGINFRLSFSDRNLVIPRDQREGEEQNPDASGVSHHNPYQYQVAPPQQNYGSHQRAQVSAPHIQNQYQMPAQQGVGSQVRYSSGPTTPKPVNATS